MTEPVAPRRAYRDAVALVLHHRREDDVACDALLPEILDDPVLTATVMSALAELVNAALSEQPADPGAWLSTLALVFAVAEHDDLPPV